MSNSDDLMIISGMHEVERRNFAESGHSPAIYRVLP